MKNETCYNLKELQLLGKGTQGTVYRVDKDKCIKVFKKTEAFRHELTSLQMAQNNPCFPKLYFWGKKYIVREYIDGIELDKYLTSNPLTLEISQKLAEVYDAFVEVGYNRRDTALLHIFITPSGDLRVIDTAKAMEKHSKYPSILLKDLENLGHKGEFMMHLKEIRPDIYLKLINIR